MLADYQIIDSAGALVSANSPYSKVFVSPSFGQEPYFTIWIKTGYSSGSSAASVRLNGTEIAKIWPRPWLNHSYLDFEAEAFPFSNSLLAKAPPPIQFLNFWFNQLDIVPKGGVLDYVLLSNVIYHIRN
jgi:hypothetical protein